MAASSAIRPAGVPRRTDTVPVEGTAALVAPAAVRVIDLEAPLDDLCLQHSGPSTPYRSLLAVARLQGDPLVVATFSVDPAGLVSRDRLADGLCRRLMAGLADGGSDLASLSPRPTLGVPGAAAERVRSAASPVPPVTVLVPTCGNPHALERCVRSIFSCEYEDFEVIVVENRPGSSDTARMLATRFPAQPRLRYLEEPRQGASRARNAGLAYAEGEIVAFTHDDVVVDPGWIRASVDALMRTEDIACVTGLILPLELDTESQLLLGQFASLDNGFRRCVYRLPEARDQDSPFPPYSAGAIGSGASIVMRADVLRELGGFDPVLGPATLACGGEDLDLYIRILRAGRALAYEPSAIVWHQDPRDMPRLRRHVYRYGVGLGAMLAKQLIAGPERRDVIRAVPAGVRCVRDPGSRKNASKPTNYPRHLTWVERLGMVVGPAAYVLSALTALARHLAGTDGRATTPPVRTVRRIVVRNSGTAGVAWFEKRELPVPRLYRLPAGPERARTRPGRGGIVRARRSAARILVAVRQPTALHVGLVLLAIAVWAGTLPAADVRRMTDLGLVSVLSIGYFVAMGVLTASFCIAVRSRDRHWALLGAHVVVLIVMLHGTPAILYDTLRYSWAWKHVGVVDYIVRHGSVNPNIGELAAYQNWPGFFALVALIVKVGGFGSALAFASWAPLFNNLLFAAAAMLIFQSLSTDRRLSWLAVWIFCATNWVGQDYFSPQAMSYFLYLIVLGIALRWLRPSPELPYGVRSSHTRAPRSQRKLPVVRRWVRSDRLARRLRRVIARALAEGTDTVVSRRRELVAILITIAAAIVASHQLTPFMLILSLAALVAFQLCVARGLPLLIALLTSTWVIYMSVGFLKGNLYWIVASIGSLNIGGSTLTNLARASHDQVIVAETARGLTLLVGALAVAGLLRRMRHHRTDLAAVLLVCAPALMVWGNAYGGEVLFRIYFFALPFLAFLVAGLVFPSARASGSRRVAAAMMALCALLLAGMLVAYYGKERMNYFSHDEVRAADYLYTHAPAGSMLISGTGNYPWAFRNYELYKYLAIGDQGVSLRRRVIADPVSELTQLMGVGAGGRGYLIITRGQRADVEMNGVLPAGSLDRIERAVERSPSVREVYRGRDAQVFVLVRTGGRS